MAQSSSGVLFLTTNYGIYKSTDNGLSWIHTGDTVEYFSDIVTTELNEIYVGSHNLYKSIDFCQSLQLLTPGIDLLSLISSSDNSIYIGKSGGIFKSYDGGYTWDTVHQTGNSQLFTGFLEKDSVIYAASVDWSGNAGGVFKSDISGTTWTQHALETSSIQDISVDNNNRIVAACNGSINYGPGVFRSDSLGNNFVNIYSDNEVDAVSVDEYGGIYLGLESDLALDWGVRFSSDDGNSWVDKSSGMEECSYFNQIFVSSNNYLFAITQIPYKLYRSINPVVNIEETSGQTIFDIIIYPIPFKDRIAVVFNSYKPNHCIIQIYKTTGDLLVCKEFLSKQNEYIIEIDACQPGLYILCIQTEKILISRKIMKIKY